MRPGSFLFLILIILIILALFGVVEWDSVGGWLKIMVYIAVAGIAIIFVGVGIGRLFEKSD